MTRPLAHPHADQMLVETIVELGCLAPTYTRAKHPGVFAIWEERANEVLRLASLLPAGKTTDRLEGLKRECDRFTGAPLPAPLHRISTRQPSLLLDGAIVVLLVVDLVLGAYVAVAFGSSSKKARTADLGPKIGLRAVQADFRP